MPHFSRNLKLDIHETSDTKEDLEMEKIIIERNIFDIFQVERRMTANVPPDSSMNAIE